MNKAKIYIIPLLLVFLACLAACDFIHLPALPDDPSLTMQPFVTSTTIKVVEETAAPSVKTVGVFTGQPPRMFPPFLIEYDLSSWEYRGFNADVIRTRKALFSRDYPSCYFDSTAQPHSNYEPAEYIDVDGRVFRSRKEAASIIIIDKEQDMIVYEFTYPGIENIENTPTPHGRYGGFWKFLLVASPEEMPGCYPLALDLLRSFEPNLKAEPTQMADPDARLLIYVGTDQENEIAFSYLDSDWMHVKEGHYHPILISRTIPECSFEGYNQGGVPGVSDWDKFQVNDETYYFVRDPNLYNRPDTRVVIYTLILRTWWFEVYTPAEYYDDCMASVRLLLGQRELTPLEP